ncbi:MAG: hypothetical protein M4579_006928 [Chaenotheca gracillima]|nr:MAG: hypothetical protein M4579_006928 [Chaenotheca gracillima]
MAAQPARIFRPPATPRVADTLPSSSPAFATPMHPVREVGSYNRSSTPVTLPVLLPPNTLRPLAFRTFTKKHNLTLSSSALQALAAFIGKQCGTGWREEGLAEKVLEEVAKQWKKNSGGVIVDGQGEELKTILKELEECMHGGRIILSRKLSRQSSSANVGEISDGAFRRPGTLGREDSQTSLGFSGLDMDEDEEDESMMDVRRWMRVVGAFEQPQLHYNVNKKHFEKPSQPPSMMPPPSHKTALFRQRYNVIHQRLLRNEAFQTSSAGASRHASLQRSASNVSTTTQSYKITPISNLLGRSGSTHLLLGMLTVAPAGRMTLSDFTGSITLELKHAKDLPTGGAWFGPGMIILIDGMYEESGDNDSGMLGTEDGVGGTIGGKFLAFTLMLPPCEPREVTLGSAESKTLHDRAIETTSGGFGWVDFLGVGSERAVGSRMRRFEQRVLSASVPDPEDPSCITPADETGRSRVVVLGDLLLDYGATLVALRRVFSIYSEEPTTNIPMAFVLVGNFVTHAVMAGGGASGGGVEYKEAFDALAAILTEFPRLLQNSTFIFVPGDNDPWASSASGGASCVLPRRGIPEMFTSRIKRAFATANAEARKSTGVRSDGEAIWTTNPARISVFGPTHEIVLMRDDMLRRMRRNSILFRKPHQKASKAGRARGSTAPSVPHNDEDMDIDPPSSPPPTIDPPPPETSMEEESAAQALKLTRTLLDQGYLSPFNINTRPVHWDYAPSSLSLYPLPSALILVDSEAPPFAVTHEGCTVLNPGRLTGPRSASVGVGAELAMGPAPRVPTVQEASLLDSQGRKKTGKDAVMAEAFRARRERALKDEKSRAGRPGRVCKWVEYTVLRGRGGEGRVREAGF